MCQIEELSVWCLSTATNPENLDFRLLFCRTEHGQVGFRPEKERSGNRCHPSEADVRHDADQIRFYFMFHFRAFYDFFGGADESFLGIKLQLKLKAGIFTGRFIIIFLLSENS